MCFYQSFLLPYGYSLQKIDHPLESMWPNYFKEFYIDFHLYEAKRPYLTVQAGASISNVISRELRQDLVCSFTDVNPHGYTENRWCLDKL